MDTQPNHTLTEVTESFRKIDGGRIIRMLRNPLEALRLSEKEWLYGALGLAASFLGYLIWVLLFGSKITDLIYGFIPFGGLFAPSRMSFEMFSRMVSIGILSNLALLASIWLTGWWKSGVQPHWKLFLARMGAMQYITGAGFLLAGLLSFSFTLSFLALSVTLLSSLVMSVYGGAEASAVSKERASSYLILSVALYVVLLGVFLKLLF